MTRVTLLCLLISAAGSAAGCKKSSTSTTPPTAGARPTQVAGTKAGGVQAGTSSADDQLMLDYLRLRNEVAALLEKKAPEADIREASTRSSAKLRELQALPRDRQAALQSKYQKEWTAANERVGKAIVGGQQ